MMKVMLLEDFFTKLYTNEYPFAAVAWDGDTNFAYTRDRSDAHCSWEFIQISDLEKNSDSCDEIISNHMQKRDHVTRNADYLQSLLRSLFSTNCEIGFFIWHEDSSGESFGITKNDVSQSDRWNLKPTGWDQWVGEGHGQHGNPQALYLGRFRPN